MHSIYHMKCVDFPERIYFSNYIYHNVENSMWYFLSNDFRDLHTCIVVKIDIFRMFEVIYKL